MDDTRIRNEIAVLEAGRLTLCERGSSSERQLELGELLERMANDPHPSIVDNAVGLVAPHESSDTSDLVSGQLIGPGIPCACLLGGGAAFTYSDARSHWVRIEPQHVRVLAAVWHPSTVGQLADRSGLDPSAVGEAVAHLLDHGLLWRAEANEPAAPEPNHDNQQSLAHSPDALSIDTAETFSTPGSGFADSRIPVYSFWATESGPHLGSAAVVAYARVHGDGKLTDRFDLRRTAPAHDVLNELSTRHGPAILLCSNYIWSLDANLDVAAKAVEINPEVIVVHGGPSTPRYDEDCAAFLRGLTGRHILVHGEGELTFTDLLEALADVNPPGSPHLRLDGIHDVSGIRYLDAAHDRIVETPKRDRHTRLEDFPSPLLSGEFDDVPREILTNTPISIETNRGCPYSCTFCDWGQNTMSRIRKFPLDRVRSEFEWLANHRIDRWILADANFGILQRDLEITDDIVHFKAASGFPKWILIAPPKNATNRFVEIIDRLLKAGLSMKTALALQTRDAGTLETIRRSNIGTSSYDDLTIALRERGLPLSSDLMMGLPGATVESFLGDLQWCIDEQVRAYIWPTFILPNAPMNDPDYRADNKIRAVGGLVMETSTYTAEDRERMDRYAYAYQILEVLGVLRHVIRFVQWERGIPASEVIARIVDTTAADPDRYPLLDWLLHHSDVFLVAPVGWAPLYDEIRRMLLDDLGVAAGTDLEVVLEANEFLLPSVGRTIPDHRPLDHDYVAYFADARQRLHTPDVGGHVAPLSTYGPGSLTIEADPDDVCRTGLRRLSDGRLPDGYVGEFSVEAHIEMLSPLLVHPPFSAAFLAITSAGAWEGMYGRYPEEEGAAEPVAFPQRRAVTSS